ncbi:hypothetical protein GCM10008018_45350 [Paenibacillus marchantiophytorum]|uniref:Uncharacterized protein n=1 Tax=Paenibacillus marchantiophytorum TaxID=1619310 RepID=A0ABQ1EYX3_9BACL|nr:hypothetical protein [Paenibacillus marchantiophytorum]GFZ93843.1 hypothetical protein GCM10008018_45350 [Paenibacillus marchantiophytorum]
MDTIVVEQCILDLNLTLNCPSSVRRPSIYFAMEKKSRMIMEYHIATDGKYANHIKSLLEKIIAISGVCPLFLEIQETLSKTENDELRKLSAKYNVGIKIAPQFRVNSFHRQYLEKQFNTINRSLLQTLNMASKYSNLGEPR